MKATVVLPVKRFSGAKRRLADSVDQRGRGVLLGAMLEDVLRAVDAAEAIERVVVVTGDKHAERVAMRSAQRLTTPIEVLRDPSDEGHSEAALAGIAAARGSDCIVLLPIDCLLLDPRELDRLLTGVPERYVAVVPDRHGTGTNALVLAPPSAIRPAFGEGSCARHVAAARDAGVPYGVEELASLGLDLDTPADVVALTRELEANPGRAKRTAKALGI